MPVLLQLVGQVMNRGLRAPYRSLQGRRAGFEGADILLDCGWSLHPHVLRDSWFDTYVWPCDATGAYTGKFCLLRPGERLADG
jgi:hypothetical protein